MEVRIATVADAAEIARVHVETWRAAYAGMIPSAVLDALSVPAGTSRWEGLLADPDRRVWVAAEGERALGFAAAGPPRDADVDPGAGEVYAVYVHPAAQRRGAGTALLDAAGAWLATPESVLWVLTANAVARAFYEARGWAPDGAERAIDVGGAVVDEVRYRNRSAVQALTFRSGVPRWTDTAREGRQG